MRTRPAVRVATDSLADIPADLADELGIAVVPATITFGQQTYSEGVNLSREEFYARLVTHSGLPTTAAPGPGAFLAAFQRLVAENRQAGAPLEGIVSFHPPAHLSGLYNSAYSASQMLEGVRVVVVDTGQITMGVGWMAIAAARAASQGQSLATVLALVEDIRGKTQLVAGLETLEWAARSGRVNRLVATLGNLLSVKPIIRFLDGEITLAERVRTHARQVERVLEMAMALAPFREVAVMHARAPDVASALADRLGAVHQRERVVVAEIGCVLGTYAGPGAYGIVTVQP